MKSFFLFLIVLVYGTDVSDSDGLSTCLSSQNECSLTTNIDLTLWTPITEFSGLLNGNSYTIKLNGITLIEKLTNANIVNLKLELPNTQFSASFVGKATSSNFTDIIISGSTVIVENTSKYYGLLVSEITKCNFNSIKIDLTSFNYTNTQNDETDVGIISGRGGGLFSDVNITITNTESFNANVLFFGHAIGNCQNSNSFKLINIKSSTLDLNSKSISKKPQYGGLCGWALSYDANDIKIEITTINMKEQTPYIYGTISGQVITDSSINKASIIINQINMNFVESTSTANSYIGLLIGTVQCKILVLNDIEIKVGKILIQSTDTNTVIEYGAIVGSSITSFDTNNIKTSIDNIEINITNNIYIGGFSSSCTSNSNDNLNMNVKNGVLIEYSTLIDIKSTGSVYFGGISTLFKGSNIFPFYMIVNYNNINIESNKIVFGGLFAQTVTNVIQAFTTFNSVIIKSKDITIGGLIGSDKDLNQVSLTSSTIKQSFSIINSLKTEGITINNQYIGGFVGYNKNSFNILSSYVIIKKLEIGNSVTETVYGTVVGINDNTNKITASKVQINELIASKNDKSIYKLINGKETKVTTIDEFYISIPLNNEIITVSDDYNSTSYMMKCDENNNNNHCEGKMAFETGEDKNWSIQNDLLIISTLPNFIDNNQFSTTSSISTDKWDLTKWNIPLSGLPYLLYFTSTIENNVVECSNDGECSKGQMCSNNKCINLNYCNNIKSTTTPSTCLFNIDIEGICLNSICYPKCNDNNGCSDYNSHSTCINNACYISCNKNNECYHEETCVTSTKACNLICKTKDQCKSNEWCDRNTCNECPLECLECNTNLICTKCESGYSLINNKCLTSCGDGYYSKDNVCEKCDSKCNTCNEVSTNCTSCNDGFILYNSECVSSCPDGTINIANRCENCDDSCKTCSGTTKKCTSCKTEKYLYENNCLDSCEDGFIYDDKNICKKCPEDQFKLDNKCVTTCSETTFNNRITGNCDKCNSTCSSCNTIATNCTSCRYSEGYFLQLTKYPSVGRCITEEEGCDDGYYPESTNSTCNECIKGCKKCRDVKYCTSCEEMYVLKGGGKCVFFTDDEVDGVVMAKPIIFLLLIVLLILVI